VGTSVLVFEYLHYKIEGGNSCLEGQLAVAPENVAALNLFVVWCILDTDLPLHFN
jgi:hypothetical protein